MNQSSSAFAPYLGGPGLQVSISPGTVLCSNVSTDSTKAPDGIPLAVVVTGASSVLSLTDVRPDIII